MLGLPGGEIYMNEVKRENSIAFTDNPRQAEIDSLFAMWKKAEKLIYVANKKIVKEYTRS